MGDSQSGGLHSTPSISTSLQEYSVTSKYHRHLIPIAARMYRATIPRSFFALSRHTAYRPASCVWRYPPGLELPLRLWRRCKAGWHAAYQAYDVLYSRCAVD